MSTPTAADAPEPAPADLPPTPEPATRPRRTAGPVVVISAVLVLVLGGSSLFLAGFLLGARTASQPGTPADAAAAFKPFWDTFAAINKDYAGEPVTRKALVDGAIKGMLEALGDPFSFYMKPEDFNDSLQGLSGQFEGIGATTASRKADGTEGCTPLGPDCGLIVIGTIVDSPAEKAGLLPGDRIAAVDGASVDGQTPDDALKKVRGPKDTVVTLTIVRGTAAPRSVAITRAVIIQPEVIARDLAGGRVGYIGVTGFSDNASAQFIKDLSADVSAGRKAIVLDLRGNLGGYVTAARAIASQFIASGPIYWEKGPTGAPVPIRGAGRRRRHRPDRSRSSCSSTRNRPRPARSWPARCRTRNGRPSIGSSRTGRGPCRSSCRWTTTTAAFRLTIARWLTPNQRWINKTGLTPDVVVPCRAEPAPAGHGSGARSGLQELGFGGAAAVDWERAGLTRASRSCVIAPRSGTVRGNERR